MVSFAIFFTFGVWLLQQQAILPSLDWAWLLLPLVATLLLFRFAARLRLLHMILAALFACLLGFFHAAWFAQHRLADKLPGEWQGRNIDIVGVVAELPRQHERGLSFAFDVERTLTPGAHVPSHILLSTYDNKQHEQPQLHAGERWQLTVRLKQPHGTANPHTFDFEEWMLERNLRASGYVRNSGNNLRLDGLVSTPDYLIEHLRERVRERFQQVLGDAPYAGVLSALAIGDQAGIPQEQWHVFTRTGVNHLMSISGLHITMLGSLAFFIVYHLWRRSNRLALYLPARKAAAIAGLLAALLYALLSGFSVPAQRTVYMLATFSFALLSSRNVAPSQLLSAALILVLLFDPWAVMAPGFWLSFGAVALILYVTANRIGKTHWLREYGKVQWAMTIGLVPPLLAMFQQVSLVSPLANAFAIPLVSFVVVPLTLLGAVLPMDWLLHFAHLAMSLCMSVLVWLNQLPDAVWRQHAPPAWSIALGVPGVLWVLLPRGFPARWLGLLLLLPMFLAVPEPPQPGELRLTIFDVGQGLAVAARTRNHVLLYDAGPDYPDESDSGSRIVVPVLHAQGVVQLDALILTHNDVDHIGGAKSVLQAMPVGQLYSSLPADHPLLQHVNHASRCADGQHWEWDGVRFDMLHPSSESYAISGIRDNDRSCVLRISTGAQSVLLAADIEHDSEQRLMRLHPGMLPATLLVVPHHGSSSSSEPSFVAKVHPRYAVFTSGYRNRFGHPRPEVVSRYREAQTELMRSDADGAILVEMDANTIEVERYRETHRRYWQQ
jgi:competence protein ComEC